MIQLRSILEVADNTGARKAAMISKKGQISMTAGVGDIITVHIKQSATEATVKKGEVAKAVVVRTKARESRRVMIDLMISLASVVFDYAIRRALMSWGRAIE